MTSVVQKLQCRLLKKGSPGRSDLPTQGESQCVGLEGQTGTERKRESRGERNTGRQTQPETFRAQRSRLITSEPRHWHPPRRHSGPRT